MNALLARTIPLASTILTAALTLGCGGAYQAMFFGDAELFFEYAELEAPHERVKAIADEGDPGAIASSPMDQSVEPEPLQVHPG